MYFWDEVNQSSNGNVMQTSKQIICQKYPKNDDGIVIDPNYKDHLYRPNMNANEAVLNGLIMKGMKPKWYIVIHFNDGGDSKRQQYRRLDIDAVIEDCTDVKDKLYTELYGKRWDRKYRRSRSIWGIEYGRSTIKPHINLIVEDLPFPYNTYHSTYILMRRILPDKCKCLWRQSGHISPVYYDKGVSQYVSKESDFTNSTIIHSITDYYIK